MNKFLIILLSISFTLQAYSQNFTFLKDIYTGSRNSSIFFLFEHNSKLFFSASSEEYGQELWETDGTPNGTKLFMDIVPGPGSSSPYVNRENGKMYKGKFYFTAVDDANGKELWSTDGTVANTKLFADINTGSESSFSSVVAQFNNLLFFNADDGSHGYELWVTDGTESGTKLLKDIAPGSKSSNADGFLKFKGKLYFLADNYTNGRELWETDGTAAGTKMIKDILPGSKDGAGHLLVPYKDHFYFAGDDGVTGKELWTSDGTSSGTKILIDLYAGAEDGIFLTAIFANSDLIYFTGTNGTNGHEVWISDGSSSGTSMLKDINEGPGDGYPRDFLNYNGMVLFTASEPVNGQEIWITDGTTSGTQLVKDLVEGPYAGTRLLGICGGLAFYSAAYTELASTDGTSEGTQIHRPSQANYIGDLKYGGYDCFDDNVYLWVTYDTTTGRELWKYNIPEEAGVKPLSNKKQVKLVPNPAQSEVTISSQNVIKAVSIYNMNGQMITEYFFNQINPTFDISTYDKGVYFLNVFLDNQQITQRLIVY